jgi:Flp pilus assembly protein TadD
MTVPDEDREPSRLEQFRQIVDLDPDDSFSRFGYASALYDAGCYHEAVREFRQAIRLKPDYSAAFRDLGKALERTGAQVEARQVYLEGIPIAERNGDLQTLKEMQVFLKRLEQGPGQDTR